MSLTLELNKKYVSRNGEIFTVVGFDNTRHHNVITNRLIDGNISYRHFPNGTFGASKSCHKLDLIHEYIEEGMTLSPEKILRSYFKYNDRTVKVKSITASIGEDGNLFTSYVFEEGGVYLGDINKLPLIEVEEIKIKNRSVFEYNSTIYVYIEGILYRMDLKCDLIKLPFKGSNVWIINNKMIKIVVE